MPPHFDQVTMSCDLPYDEDSTESDGIESGTYFLSSIDSKLTRFPLQYGHGIIDLLVMFSAISSNFFRLLKRSRILRLNVWTRSFRPSHRTLLPIAQEDRSTIVLKEKEMAVLQ